MKQIRKISDQLVENYIKKNKNIVFVGMTAKIPKVDKKYFKSIKNL
jgi:uncharacterized protein with HEPN domain